MKKPRAVGLIAALGLLLGGCGAKPLALEPEKLQQADGSFGLSEVSLGATVEETEKALGVSLKEPVRESSGIASYEIDGAVCAGRRKVPYRAGVRYGRTADGRPLSGGGRGGV